jgi:hypothetical protein
LKTVAALRSLVDTTLFRVNYPQLRLPIPYVSATGHKQSPDVVVVVKSFSNASNKLWATLNGSKIT